MLPPLASLADFEIRFPGGLPSGDTSRATAALEDASALVRQVAGKTWINDEGAVEDVPDIVAVVTIAAARRAVLNPDGIRSESIDDYSTTFSNSSPDIYLTKSEVKLVRQAAGKSGVWTQPTTRSEGDVPDLDTVYLDVEPAGDPIPWASKGDLGVS